MSLSPWLEPRTENEKRKLVVYLAAVAAECRSGALEAAGTHWAALELAQAVRAEAAVTRLLATYQAPRQPKENP